MKNANGTGEAALREEISGLREQLMEVTARLQALEGDENGADGDGKPTSRRDLLKLAGALAAGAAGGIVLRPLPAAAASGGNMILGQANDANAPTTLGPTGTATPTALFEVLGQIPPTIPANPAAHTSTATPPVTTAVTVPVLLAVSPFGVFPKNGATPPVAVYPGVAPVQGIGGPVNRTFGATTVHVAEGVDGFAAVDSTDTSAVGAGVVGQSDFGVGVVGSAATDFLAGGLGYIAQVSITDSTGAVIAGPPPAPVYNFEQARDKNGVLWLSTVGAGWRRMNTTIPISPFRVYDSRPNARPANSVTNIQITGVGGVPADAIGVFGNLTALGPAADGFLQIFPTGSALGQFNNLNYTRGVSAVSNFVMVSLGTGGQVSVFVSGNGATNFLFDVGGYIQ
jgi:hypothetical protein